MPLTHAYRKAANYTARDLKRWHRQHRLTKWLEGDTSLGLRAFARLVAHEKSNRREVARAWLANKGLVP